MNEELYQKLIEAGFPTKNEGGSSYCSHCGDGGPDGLPPTLSELVAACGKKFHCLIHTINGGAYHDKEFWSAGKNNIVMDWQNGSTPEEAVAKLWLALNKEE